MMGRKLPIFCLPDWWNGRHAGLRNQCLVRAGSSPVSGTRKTVNTLLTLGVKRHGASLLEGARGKVSLGSRYDLHLLVK